MLPPSSAPTFDQALAQLGVKAPPFRAGRSTSNGDMERGTPALPHAHCPWHGGPPPERLSPLFRD